MQVNVEYVMSHYKTRPNIFDVTQSCQLLHVVGVSYSLSTHKCTQRNRRDTLLFGDILLPAATKMCSKTANLSNRSEAGTANYENTSVDSVRMFLAACSLRYH